MNDQFWVGIFKLKIWNAIIKLFNGHEVGTLFRGIKTAYDPMK